MPSPEYKIMGSLAPQANIPAENVSYRIVRGGRGVTPDLNNPLTQTAFVRGDNGPDVAEVLYQSPTASPR